MHMNALRKNLKFRHRYLLLHQTLRLGPTAYTIKYFIDACLGAFMYFYAHIHMHYNDMRSNGD